MLAVTEIIGVSFSVLSKWELISLTTPIKNLYLNYKKVWATIIDDDSQVKYLDLDTIRAQASIVIDTLETYLNTQNGLLISLSATRPIGELKTIAYKDSVNANYKATPIHPIYGENCLDSLKTAVKLTRNVSVDYSLLYKRSLVSVNGFLHLTDSDQQTSLTVIDAYKSLKVAKHNAIGIISFASIADIQTFPITQQMVLATNGPNTLYQRADIQLPIDVSEKTVLLSLGGYLFLPNENTFTKISDNAISIDFNNLNFEARYYESKNYINLDSMPVSQIEVGSIPPTQMYSDENILAYLTLSQSFVIVIDAPLYVRKQAIKNSGDDAIFITTIKPHLPLQIGLGRLAEYQSNYEDGIYQLTVMTKAIDKLIYNTALPGNRVFLNNAVLPMNPIKTYGASFIELGAGM